MLAAVVSDEPMVPARQRRGRRARGVARARTLAVKKITREELRVGTLLYPVVDVERPTTRGECAPWSGGEHAQRPCPFVSCKHHLYLDINPETGSVKINFPDREPWELEHTCALDVAERGGITLEEVGEIMNLTRERIRQVEVKALLTVKAACDAMGIDAGDVSALAAKINLNAPEAA